MDYKVGFIPAVGWSISFERECETLKDAVLVLEGIANYTLFLHRQKIMPDFTNCGMIYKKVGDEWIELDDDGNEI